MPDRIIVVGGGQAGAALVAKLRGLGHKGRLTLIGAEPTLPYQRPPLSKKYLLGEMALERLFLRPESFYAENEIEVRIGTKVTAIDRDSRILRIGDEELPWDKLALTTGSKPRHLPEGCGGDLAGVHYMRNLVD